MYVKIESTDGDTREGNISATAAKKIFEIIFDALKEKAENKKIDEIKPGHAD